ncbi:MAG: enoyl-CoA hydratase/isomerase family protein [Deltaproteobacteria bacterium]|nr:enoyl-CoA hydratase/isomerase family protein [Candidatus Zymogenaceae bacterium]
MEKFTTMLLTRPEPGLMLITLNRPDSLNAIGPDMLDEFDNLFRLLNEDESIKVVIITGAGRGFCAGADLMAAVTHEKTDHFKDPERFIKLVQERYGSIIQGFRKIPQPVIAAVNGPAAGGGFCIALAADVRIAAPEALFVASFINIGLSGGELGSSYLLPRLIGLSAAADILYSGRKVRADEAEKIGLVKKVVPVDKLMEAAVEIAKPMLAKSGAALKFTKRALDQNIDAPSLEVAMNFENRNQTIMVFSGTFFEMVKNFTASTAGKK